MNPNTYTTMPERMSVMETQMVQVINILNEINYKMDNSNIDSRLQKVESTNKILIWLFGIIMLVFVAITGSVGSEYCKTKLFGAKYEGRSNGQNDATTVLSDSSRFNE